MYNVHNMKTFIFRDVIHDFNPGLENGSLAIRAYV